MKRYDPRTPRMLLGFAAVALTAATLAVSVYGPAAFDASASDADIVTSVVSERCVPADDAVMTAMDVIAVRAPRAGHVAPVAQSHEARQDALRS
jgi:hypothetical protein